VRGHLHPRAAWVPFVRVPQERRRVGKASTPSEKLLAMPRKRRTSVEQDTFAWTVLCCRVRIE
jgi:hypothetical protein